MALTWWILALLLAGGADESWPQHIHGEAAVDQYLQAHIEGGYLRLRVETDYAEFPGARWRQEADRNRDGRIDNEELDQARQRALAFALRYTQVQLGDQALALRPHAPPQLDLYDFAQTGAKPVRELVDLVADLPAESAGIELTISTHFRPASRAHVSRIFVTVSAPWQLVDGGDEPRDGLDYETLRAASRAGVAPPGFDDRPQYQRRIRLLPAGAAAPAEPTAAVDPPLEPSSPYRHWTNALGEKLFHADNPLAWWLGILIAFVYGMGHALAPGHGKALMSAWLLGQRGRVSDALIAGLSATAAHTVMVFALGLAFTLTRLLGPNDLEAFDSGIALLAGLIMLGMGVWMLQRALSGRGHHHHDHDHSHDHDHDHDHSHDHGHHHHHHRQAGLVGLVAGMAPCPAGVAIVIFAASQSAPALGLFYALIFSLGMASVLVAIAIAVTYGLRFSLGKAAWLHPLLARAPMVSGLVILLLGFWVGADALARLGWVG